MWSWLTADGKRKGAARVEEEVPKEQDLKSEKQCESEENTVSTSNPQSPADEGSDARFSVTTKSKRESINNTVRESLGSFRASVEVAEAREVLQKLKTKLFPTYLIKNMSNLQKMLVSQLEDEEDSESEHDGVVGDSPAFSKDKDKASPLVSCPLADTLQIPCSPTGATAERPPRQGWLTWQTKPKTKDKAKIQIVIPDDGPRDGILPSLGVAAVQPEQASFTDSTPSSSSMSSQEPMSPAKPLSIELIQPLGEGGQGKVWEAVDDYGHPVAVKFILTSKTRKVPASSLAREFRMLTKVPPHPNIVPVLGADTVKVEIDESAPIFPDDNGFCQQLQSIQSMTNFSASFASSSGRSKSRKQGKEGVTFIVMELCVPLHTMFQQYRTRMPNGWRLRLPERLAILVARDTLRALEHLEKHKIVHGDIKPANLLTALRDDGTICVKVSDFGLAAFFKPLASGSEIAGTPRYMAPEHVQGQPTPKSDVWSLGCSIIELLTGLVPFHHLSHPFQVAHALRNVGARPEIPKVPEISQDAYDFLDICLILDPENRPSPGDLLRHAFISKVGSTQTHQNRHNINTYSITNLPREGSRQMLYEETEGMTFTDELTGSFTRQPSGVSSVLHQGNAEGDGTPPPQEETLVVGEETPGACTSPRSGEGPTISIQRDNSLRLTSAPKYFYYTSEDKSTASAGSNTSHTARSHTEQDVTDRSADVAVSLVALDGQQPSQHKSRLHALQFGVAPALFRAVQTQQQPQPN